MDAAGAEAACGFPGAAHEELPGQPGKGPAAAAQDAPGAEGDGERHASVVEPLQIAVEGVQGV